MTEAQAGQALTVQALTVRALTVHVIDDEASMRSSLQILLQTEGYKVQTYPLARNFLNSVENAENGCVVTDVRMPDMDGIQLMAALRQRNSLFPVVVITAFADVALAVQAMKMGAVDFIEKPFDASTLFAAVRGAMALAAPESVVEMRAITERLASLSPREIEILQNLLKGRLNKTIAYELGISVRTVEAHRANLMEKMQADSLSQLVRMALLASSPYPRRPDEA
jgi:two-component system response regulator FixJ